ncbi:MAG: histidine kinase [Chitinophagaceae bacterium]
MAVNDFSFIIIVVVIVFAICGALAVALYYIYKNVQLKRTQELLRSEIEIHEQSFQNISHEIHDNIGQVLSLAKLNLNAVEAGLSEEKSEKIRNSKDLVGQAIADLRNLSKNLNAAVITEIGLSEAIKRELDQLSKSGRYETDFSQDGKAFRLQGQKELIIFRIFQQIIYKVAAQPDVKKLKIKTLYSPCRFKLAVWDDGTHPPDFPIISPVDHRHPGGTSMFTRASIIGAELTVYSNIERGNTTIFTLNLAGDN